MEFVFHLQISRLYHQFHTFRPGLPRLPRMELVTNGTLSSQTEIPKRNFPNFFVNEKRLMIPSFFSLFHYGIVACTMATALAFHRYLRCFRPGGHCFFFSALLRAFPRGGLVSSLAPNINEISMNELLNCSWVNRDSNIS